MGTQSISVRILRVSQVWTFPARQAGVLLKCANSVPEIGSEAGISNEFGVLAYVQSIARRNSIYKSGEKSFLSLNPHVPFSPYAPPNMP